MSVLDGRVAVVTGGASGLGRATSIRLASAGAHVVVADINARGAEDTVACIKQNGDSAEPACFDVTSSLDRKELIEDLDNRYGVAFNILINVAGIDIPGYLDDLIEEAFLQVVAVNFTGPVLLTRLLAEKVASRPPNSVQTEVLQVCSMSAISAASGGIAYNGSKAGFRNAVKCMQIELAQRLRGRINQPPLPLRMQLLNPAAMDTPMMERWGLEPEIMMRPEDVAEQILYDITRPRGCRVSELFLLPERELH